MQRMVVWLTVFFLVASLGQLFYLHNSIANAPTEDFDAAFEANLVPDLEFEDWIEAAKLESLLLLEANALERRHHQANVLLMSRVWVRYLGFVTGMTLTMVGAAFVLGKLQESSSDMRASGGGAQMSVKTNSPGIVLAVLGVVLMVTTIVTHHDIEVRDVAVFVSEREDGRATAAEKAKPALDR